MTYIILEQIKDNNIHTYNIDETYFFILNKIKESNTYENLIKAKILLSTNVFKDVFNIQNNKDYFMSDLKNSYICELSIGGYEYELFNLGLLNIDHLCDTIKERYLPNYSEEMIEILQEVKIDLRDKLIDSI